MEFGRRDIILIVGLLLFMIGLMPFVAPVYAVIVVVMMYFGIKIFVAKRTRSVQMDIGPEGICMECGGKISSGRCPSCDAVSGKRDSRG